MYVRTSTKRGYFENLIVTDLVNREAEDSLKKGKAIPVTGRGGP
jgi:hypothetical protein